MSHKDDELTKTKLWAAIEKTLQETDSPPESNVEELVADTMREYWRRRASEQEEQVEPIEIETARLARRVADNLGQRELEFWIYLGFTTVPIIPALLVLSIAWMNGFQLTESAEYWSAIPALLLAAVVILTARPLLARTGIVNMQSSMGALAGSILVATFAVLVMHHQLARTRVLSLHLGQDKLERVALFSIGSRQMAGSFVTESASSAELDLSTEEISSGKAVYRASLKSLPGVLVANLRPGSGELRWARRGGEEIRSLFEVGTIEALDSGRWRLRTSEDQTIILTVGPDAFGPPPTVGDSIAVAFDPSTSIIAKYVPLHKEEKK
jgi:hypothetical protein